MRFKNKTLWGLVPVNGEFTDVSGDGHITAKGAVFGRVDVRAASLRTGIGKRDEHLRSPDFFDVKKYPEISMMGTPGSARRIPRMVPCVCRRMSSRMSRIS